MMRKFSLSALVAAGLLVGGLSAGSASAADLGGNCCADLEERIAELEATTARKGNRKVSLTISGWVGEQVMWWDDGGEQNTYVVGLGSTLANNVKFTGQATILPGWYAGYVLHIEYNDSDSLTINQNQAVGPPLYSLLTNPANNAVHIPTVTQSFWFIKSDHLGKVSIGLQSQASDNTAILVDGSGSLVPANWVAFDTRAFFLRNKVTGALTAINWGANAGGNCRGMGGAWGDCNGLTQEAVRYDSPTWHGFSVSADWGADDFWDVAARYAGEFNGIKISVAAAYDQVTDSNYNNLGVVLGTYSTAGATLGPLVQGQLIPNNGRMDYFQLGAYVEHVPTGLWFLFNYGRLDDNFSAGTNASGNAVTADATQTYYYKGGLRERWHPLGHTVLYGEYLQSNDAYASTPAAGVISTDNRLQVWGVGLVQEIDAAAMSMWLSYRHLNYKDDSTFFYDNFQYVKFGALINF